MSGPAMGSFWQRYGLVVKALAVAAALVALKWWVATHGLEVITTLPLLTGLMGAVVFTLAILLAGVLADFKESEKLVTELVAELERLHADLDLVFREPAALARGRGHVRTLTGVLLENLRDGSGIHLRQVRAPLAALDGDLKALAAAGGPPNYIIFVRQHILAVQRIVQRLEGIIETTFVTTAYAIAGLVVAAALAAFLLTDLEPLTNALLLYGFGAFLLTGLFMLIQDLDNPFSGHARVDLRAMAKMEAALSSAPPAARAPGEAAEQDTAPVAA